MVAAGDGIEPTAESLTENSTLLESEALNGSRSRSAGDRGVNLVNGDLENEMKYEGLDVLLAMALGAAAAPVQQASDDAYQHDFTVLDTDLVGLHGTLAIEKQVSVWEFRTCKIGGWTLEARQNQLTTLTVNLIASDVDRASAVNDSTTMLSVTIPANRNFLLWEELAVRMNATTGAALANTDLVYPSEFRLSVQNQFRNDDVTTRYGRDIDEPCPNGFLLVTGSIGFSKYEDDVFVAANETKTAQKMDVIFTGPIADGTTNFRLSAFLPSLQVSSGTPNVSGPGAVPQSYDFSCSKVTSLPAGFPAGFLGAISIELVNQRNTDVLT